MSSDARTLHVDCCVGVPCYEKQNNLSHVYNCILYFIQYYVLHCIDPDLKMFQNCLILMFLFVVGSIIKVFTFYHQIID